MACCKIVGYHHHRYCPVCPNLMEFVSGDYLDKKYPSSLPTDPYTPYEFWPANMLGDKKQPWCNVETWEEVMAQRQQGPPRPTDTIERQRAWFKKMFPNL